MWDCVVEAVSGEAVAKTLTLYAWWSVDRVGEYVGYGYGDFPKGVGIKNRFRELRKKHGQVVDEVIVP